ncbi:MAG: PAS domain S-box protein [Steroidobacteraceae bacterium]
MNLIDPSTNGHNAKDQESKALEQARSYLAALAEHSPAALIGLSMTGVIEFWNASAERVLGHTAAEVVGKDSRLLSPPDFLDRHRALSASVRTGQIVRLETQLMHRNGERLWVLATSGPVKAHDGTIIGVSISVLDIGSNKATELQLRATERRHAFLVRLSDFLRRSSEAAEIKEVACTMLGHELRAALVYYAECEEDQDHLTIEHDYHDGLASLAGRFRLDDYSHVIATAFREGHTVVVDDLMSDPFIEPDAQSLYGALELGTCVGVPLVRGDKLVMLMAVLQKEPRKWTTAEISLIEDTAERTWEALERGRAESLLRASEARLQQAMRIETVGVTSLSPAGPIINANEAFMRMSGFDLEDIRTGKLTWQALTPEEFWDASLNAVHELSTVGHSTPYEKQYIRKDGSRWWGLFAATRLPDGTCVEFIIDVTQRRELEQSLRNADRRKDEFLATLGHELRNPLAPIRNGLEIARVAAKRDEVLLRTIAMMDRQLTHLVRLVDDLLDLGRITAGKIVLRTEAVDLRQLVLSSADSARSSIDAHHHELSIDVPAEDLIVDGDFDRLSQIISNLLSNASKYTPDGGRIELRLRREEGNAVIEVIDSGIGIPQVDLTRVFELFSQVRTHQGRAEGGLGIGLSLVKSLVAMHGGTVEASSSGLEEGSTFTVRLPLHRKAAGEQPATAPAGLAEPASVARRIVVADDNRDAAQSLAVLLEMQGHEVVTAFDGVEAIERVRNTNPQVVILDLGMPNMSGLEAAKAIRALPNGAQLKLVALTGWGQESDRQRTRAAGFDRHLVKPVSYVTLAELLATLDR